MFLVKICISIHNNGGIENLIELRLVVADRASEAYQKAVHHADQLCKGNKGWNVDEVHIIPTIE